MCSSETEKILRSIAETVQEYDQDPLDFVYQISSNQPLIVHYMERRHLWLWSANALTLTLEDIGTLSVSANTWTNIGYTEGMRLTPSSSTIVAVFVRATNETVP